MSSKKFTCKTHFENQKFQETETPVIKDKEFANYTDFMYYVLENNLNHNLLYQIPMHYIYYARFLVFENLGIKVSVENLQKLINSELRKGFITFKEKKKGTTSTMP